MPLDRCVFFWECPACRVVQQAKGWRLLRVLLVRRPTMPAPFRTTHPVPPR